jgi:hypothetical protein
MDGFAGVRAAGHAGEALPSQIREDSCGFRVHSALLASQAVRRPEPVLAMLEGGNEALTMAR